MSYPSFAAKDGNLVNQAFGVSVDAFNSMRSQVSLDHQAATYSAGASFTPFVTAPVTLVSLAGNASKTLRVKCILLSGHATAVGELFVTLQRTSALGTGGTAVNPSIAKFDTNSPYSSTPTASLAHYTTAAQTGGTAVGGAITELDFTTGVITTPTILTPIYQLWPILGAVGTQSIVLRGAADILEIQNKNAGNLGTATVLEYTIMWEEDNS